VALDGDRAGLDAALRLMDLALPLLEAGRSLRFAILPQGQDPDDLIRAQGAAAMQAVLDAAQPMVGLLWRRETEGRVFDSPERRAALDRTLREKLLRDPRPLAAPPLRRGDRPPSPRAVLPGARAARGRTRRARHALRLGRPACRNAAAQHARLASRRRPGTARWEDRIREAVILAALVVNPWLVRRFESELERLDTTGPDHARLLAALLRLGPEATQARLTRMLGADALEKLFAPRHVQVSAGFRNAGDPDTAEQCVRGELEKLFRARGALRETRDAEAEIAGPADEGMTWRLRQAAEGLSQACAAWPRTRRSSWWPTTACDQQGREGGLPGGLRRHRLREGRAQNGACGMRQH
jgi:DNA primase